MRLFLDSANLDELEACDARHCISGVTTNPSIVAKEPAEFDVMRVVARACPLPVSVDLVGHSDMIGTARVLSGMWTNAVIKVPISWHALTTVAELRDNSVKVNVTACMTVNQCLMAANAGATYVSIFWNRIKDGGGDPWQVTHTVRAIFDRDKTPTEIIVGSIRHESDVEEAAEAGAHIVTVPYRFLEPMTRHPETDKAVAQFLADAKAMA